MPTNVLRIERHNIEEKSAFLPWPPTKPEAWPAERVALMKPVYKDGILKGYEGSPLSDLKWAQLQGYVGHCRMDILLKNDEIHCHSGNECCSGKTHKQYVVYPTTDGGLGGDITHFENEDLAWAREESLKCWETAQREPLFLAAIAPNRCKKTAAK